MAHRITLPIKSAKHGLIEVGGSFAPNGASAIDQTQNKGNTTGWSVAYTSAGTYTITFTDKWTAAPIAIVGSLQLAAADDKFLQAGTFTAATNTTAATLVLRVWDVSGAAATDVAANANNRVNFRCTFDNAPRRVA